MSEPLHVRLIENATLLNCMASGEIRLSRRDVRLVAMQLHLAAMELAREAIGGSAKSAVVQNV